MRNAHNYIMFYVIAACFIKIADRRVESSEIQRLGYVKITLKLWINVKIELARRDVSVYQY